MYIYQHQQTSPYLFFETLLRCCSSCFQEQNLSNISLSSFSALPKNSLFLFELTASYSPAPPPTCFLLLDLDPRQIAFALYGDPALTREKLLAQVEQDFPTAPWPFKKSTGAKNTLKKLSQNTETIEQFLITEKKGGEEALLTLVFEKRKSALQIKLTSHKLCTAAQLLHYRYSEKHGEKHSENCSSQLLFCSHKTSPLESLPEPDSQRLFPLWKEPDSRHLFPQKQSPQQYAQNHQAAVQLLSQTKEKRALKERKRLEVALNNIKKENPLQLQNFAQRINSSSHLRQDLEKAILKARKEKTALILNDEMLQTEVVLAQKITSLDPSYYIEALFSKVKRQKKRIEELEKEMALFNTKEDPHSCENFEIRSDLIEEIDTKVAQQSTPLFAGGHGEAVATKEIKKKPYRTYISTNGVEILVGKSAQDNMLVSFHHAAPQDIWLHVHPYPGSHVVVRSSDLEDRQTLKEAMLLAKHFSSRARGLKEVEITITQARHLRKIPGAPAGKVHVTSAQHKKIYHDPKTLESILKREKSPS